MPGGGGGGGTDAGSTPTRGEACNTAFSIADGTGQQAALSLTGASPDHTPLTCGATSATADVAFVWKALADETVRFVVSGGATSDDLALEVFRASICRGSVSIGCNDDVSATDSRPTLQVAVTAGRIYYIVVAAKTASLPTGLTLRIEP